VCSSDLTNTYTNKQTGKETTFQYHLIFSTVYCTQPNAFKYIYNNIAVIDNKQNATTSGANFARKV